MVVKQQQGLSSCVFLWEYQLLKRTITPANSVSDIFVLVLDSVSVAKVVTFPPRLGRSVLAELHLTATVGKQRSEM